MLIVDCKRDGGGDVSDERVKCFRYDQEGKLIFHRLTKVQRFRVEEMLPQDPGINYQDES